MKMSIAVTAGGTLSAGLRQDKFRTDPAEEDDP